MYGCRTLKLLSKLSTLNKVTPGDPFFSSGGVIRSTKIVGAYTPTPCPSHPPRESVLWKVVQVHEDSLTITTFLFIPFAPDCQEERNVLL
ncbi:hypothetical protein CDAR_477851 [Caerostris darwini]|uniref:Uncharacterized protein n=1 Tax=Caerostris darwini TaxID=1538125 RepID=A0AAV4PZF8_9ARAC|nr:hypothetical protein CDAR_477851 [Caerostris darwini]